MEEREGKGLRRIVLILAVVCLLWPLAVCAERTGDAGYADISAFTRRTFGTTFYFR